MHAGIVKRVTLLTVSMALGYASWILPRVLIAGPVEGAMPPLIHVSTDPELAKLVSVSCLFLTGIVMGFFSERYRWAALAGFATVFPIIVFALTEMVLGLASHNLWPIEFGLYVVFTIPAILGSLLGVFIREQKG